MGKAERIVVFDWGGVVVRICRSWQQGCERAGLPYDAAYDTPEIAEQRYAASKRYEVGAIGADEFLEAVAATMNNRYSAEDIRRVHEAWLIEEYPGAAELIVKLSRHDSIDTGLLSNTNHLHWLEHLAEHEGGTNRFPAVRALRHRHASHLLGIAKPDAAIFEAFEHHAGYRPEHVVYFDDLQANVDAAARRGWDAVLVDHAGDTAKQMRSALVERGLLTNGPPETHRV
ncbi:MAG: HAD-IA family hydrolase [Planctomycetota bacterium]